MHTDTHIAAQEKHIHTLISNSFLFNGLAEDHVRRLAKVSHVRALKKREALFLEGQAGSTFYLLSVGCIQLFKVAEGGRRITLRTIKPGEVFAEVILFERDTYPVTAVALNDVEVIGIQRRNVMALLNQEAFRNTFIAMLMQRQRYLADRVHELTFYDVEERLVRFLREQYGQQKRIYLTVSKKDIAASVGTTPETLSRLITRLTEEKLLTWRGKTVCVARALWKRYSEEGAS